MDGKVAFVLMVSDTHLIGDGIVKFVWHASKIHQIMHLSVMVQVGMEYFILILDYGWYIEIPLNVSDMYQILDDMDKCVWLT